MYIYHCNTNCTHIYLSKIKLFVFVFVFVFKSHDLLCAYKANHSTVQCVTMIRETVSYYLSYSNQLFMCMQDASKAFD